MEPDCCLTTLREAIKEGAQDCGGAATIHTTFETLRVRCEILHKEARLELGTLKKESFTTFQERAVGLRRQMESLMPIFSNSTKIG